MVSAKYKISVFSRRLSAASVLLSVLCLCVLNGCEVISEGERLIPVPQPAITDGRNHVLIEFTGFRCVNCPKAAEAADELSRTYGDRLITVAMHPATNPFTRGAEQYDYTCTAADTYYLHLGGLATTPFPAGNIDLQTETDGSMIDYPLWATWVAEQMEQTGMVQLTADAALQPETRQLTVRAHCYAMQQMSLQLATWLVEDSVAGAQALPDGSVDTQYYHRHMLRGTIGDEWGENVIAQLQPDEYVVTGKLPEGCDPKHCYAVVVAMDDNKTIINALQLRIE